MMVTFGLPELLIFLAILLIIFGPGCLAAPGRALRWWSRARRSGKHADQQRSFQAAHPHADRRHI
jgi:Sec-independent protein translocase protein TatA